MKKFVICLFLASGTTLLHGQFANHDMTASYGVVTTDQVTDILKDVLTTIFTFGQYEKDNYRYSGALFLTYKKPVTYRLHLGGAIGMDNVTGDLITSDQLAGTFKTRHTTLAAEGDLRWVKRERIQFYSGLGLGYTFTAESGEDLSGATDVVRSGHMNVQVNAIGMRLGRNFGGFMEVGFGYKGLLNFGLSYQFDRVGGK